MKFITLIATVSALAASAEAATNSLFVAVVSADAVVIAAIDTVMTEGEIRKVDPSARKITIKHGELKNFDMPAMTMVFKVKDPAMLEQVKAGDKVRFRADKINGAFTLMEIEVIK